VEKEKLVQDTEEFEKRTGELRDVFYLALKAAFENTLADKSEENVEKAMELLSERIDDCEVEDIGAFIAQAAITVQMVNDEVEWDY
jgi:hypothetical protein